MLTFQQFTQQFIKEEVKEVLNIDVKHLHGNKESINNDLNTLTRNPYQNAAVFLTQLRGCMERYGILLPQSLTKNFMELQSEIVYELGDDGDYFFVCYDTREDGFVEGYAQVIDNEELQELTGEDISDITNQDKISRSSTDYKSSVPRFNGYHAGKEDDGGDTSGY